MFERFCCSNFFELWVNLVPFLFFHQNLIFFCRQGFLTFRFFIEAARKFFLTFRTVEILIVKEARKLF